MFIYNVFFLSPLIRFLFIPKICFALSTSLSLHVFVNHIVFKSPSDENKKYKYNIRKFSLFSKIW